MADFVAVGGFGLVPFAVEAADFAVAAGLVVVDLATGALAFTVLTGFALVAGLVALVLTTGDLALADDLVGLLAGGDLDAGAFAAGFAGADFLAAADDFLEAGLAAEGIGARTGRQH